MRIVQHDNTLEANFKPSESTAFGIGDVSVIIDILRNKLYEYKIRTLVQEYMSNARDAHREAKQTKSIKVIAPTQFDPTFRVRDFGLGVSPERIQNVFVLYGASTKRGSNQQTGGFGIGAKSAWAYADSFTITTYIDGTLRRYVAHTGADKVGRLDLIETSSTEEQNGTMIEIAVAPKDITEFENAILRACFFWNNEEKPHLVNTRAFPYPEGKKVGALTVYRSLDSPGFLQSSAGRHGMLIIDGIPYPLESHHEEICPLISDLMDKVTQKIAVAVPNGILQVAATREKLDDCEANRKGLQRVFTKVNTELDAFLADQIAAINSVEEFAKTYIELNKYFVLADAEYQGFKFDGRYLITPLLKEVSLVSYAMRRHKLYKSRYTNGIPIDSFHDIYFDPVTDSIVNRNRRVRQHLASNNRQLWVIEKPHTPEAQNAFKVLASVVKFKDFNALPFTVPPRNVKRTKIEKQASQQNFYDLSGGRYKHQRVDTVAARSQRSALQVWMPLDQWHKEKSLISNIIDWAEQVDLKVNFTAVAQPTAKILATAKNFMPYNDWVKTLAIDSKTRKGMIQLAGKYQEFIQVLKVLDLKDKYLIKMVDLYKDAKGIYVPEVIVKMFKEDKEYLNFLELDKKLGEYKKNLSLIDSVKHWDLARIDKAELSFYVNSKLKSLGL